MSMDSLRDEDLNLVSGGNGTEQKKPKGMKIPKDKDGKEIEQKQLKKVDMTKPFIEYDDDEDDDDDDDEE